MAIIGTNDTATVRAASLPSGAAFDTAANVTVTPPTGFSATTVQEFVNELTDGTVATGVNADLLDGVQGSNYARTDGEETFNGSIFVSATSPSLLLQETDAANRSARMFRDADILYLQNQSASGNDGSIYFSGWFGSDIGNFLVRANSDWQNIWHGGIDIKHRSFTVATVPSASSSGAGTMIYVSNESGGAVPAFSDGTNWRRVTDRAIIS